VARSQLGGTLQNDILKEYQAQKEFVFRRASPCDSWRDTIAFTAAEMPKWNSISVSWYHIREAGRRPPKSSPSHWPTDSPTSNSRAKPVSRSTRSRHGSRSSSTPIDFFEEIAKYRAARRLWATWMKDHYGARNELSWKLRFHTQTAGVSLTAQQPEVNIARTAIEALAGVLGGTQSLHTNP